MASLSFSLTNGKYVATVEELTASANVDVERDQKGVITVYQRAHGATSWKVPTDVELAKYQSDVCFNLIVEAGSMDFQIVSQTEVTAAILNQVS